MSLEDCQVFGYPNEGTTANGLFNYLKDLRKWVLFYRDDINRAVSQEIIPLVIDIPDKKAYLSQPVMTQYQHLMLVRHIREQWDHLIRLYEDDWTCKPCVQGRLMLLEAAAILLNDAFTPYEVREAKQQHHVENIQRSFERLTEFFRKIMRPDEYENKEEK